LHDQEALSGDYSEYESQGDPASYKVLGVGNGHIPCADSNELIESSIYTVNLFWTYHITDTYVSHRHTGKCGFARPDEHKQAVRNGKMRLRHTMISAGCKCFDPILEFSGALDLILGILCFGTTSSNLKMTSASDILSS
jgi:hypothetical protein